MANIRGVFSENFTGSDLALYKPSKSKREAIENILRDIDPSIREYARAILENMSLEEISGIKRDELLKRIEEFKKKFKVQ
ncbi:MAG: hypothetical protein LM556_02880 [Desulfurococcaceae archaeon]|nr:hypothetical protein [Desulfurococcaceae archaeon]